MPWSAARSPAPRCRCATSIEEAKIPFIALAGAAAIVVPVRPYVFKTPHTEPMSCGKIFEDLKKRNLTKIAMISGTDGWGKAMREECLKMAPQCRRHRRQGRDLRRNRQRHDAATDQHQEHAGRPSGHQLRLRPGSGDRHPQLSPARHHGAVLPEPWRVIEELHQPCRPRGRRRAAAGRRAARRRQAARQRSAEESGDGIQDASSKRPPASQSRPSAVTCATACSCWSRR